MQSSAVNFTGALGTTLAARLDEPDGVAHAVAIFAHCFTCTKDLPAIWHIATALTNHGFAVLRFDFGRKLETSPCFQQGSFSGLGQSEGDFSQPAGYRG